MNDRDDLRWRLVFAALYQLVHWTSTQGNHGESLDNVEITLLKAAKGMLPEPKW